MSKESWQNIQCVRWVPWGCCLSQVTWVVGLGLGVQGLASVVLNISSLRWHLSHFSARLWRLVLITQCQIWENSPFNHFLKYRHSIFFCAFLKQRAPNAKFMDRRWVGPHSYGDFGRRQRPASHEGSTLLSDEDTFLCVLHRLFKTSCIRFLHTALVWILKNSTLSCEWMENNMLYSWEILVLQHMTTHLNNCLFHMGAKWVVLHLFMSTCCNYFLVIFLCAALYKYKI